MWESAVAALIVAPLAACAWMLWVIYGSARRKRPASSQRLSRSASDRTDTLEPFVLAALAELRDPGLELALRGRVQASRLLPAAPRRLVLFEIALDLERHEPLPDRAAHAAGDATSLAEPLAVLALDEEAREAFVARSIVEAFRQRLCTVLGRAPVDKALANVAELPADLDGYRELVASGGLASFVERLLADSEHTLGAERIFALLESAARDVGSKVPLGCFHRVLEQFPEEFLIAEQSHAASREALWQEFLATRQKLERAHDELSRTHALAALTELSASMAHEINNPLASVLGIVQILQSQVPPGSRQLTLLAAAESEARRIHRITSQLHEIGARSASAASVMQVRDLVHSAVWLIDRQAKAAGVRIERRLDSVPPLAADGQRVRDALVHVMSGAVASMEAGGTLTVASRLTDDGAIALVIQDTGPGVPAHVLRRVFEPSEFEKVVEPWTDGAGKGKRWVGLKAAHAIACSFHGELCIDSAEGRGSIFTFRFPAAPPEARGLPS